MHVCGHSTQEAGEKRCSGSEDSFSKKKICLKWSRAMALFSFDFVRDARPRLAEFTKRRSHSRKKICPPSCLRHLDSLCWVKNSTLGSSGSRLVLKVYFHVTPYFLNTRQSSREKTLTVNADLKPRGSGFTDSDVLPHVLRSDHWATLPRNPSSLRWLKSALAPAAGADYLPIPSGPKHSGGVGFSGLTNSS